MTAGVTDNLWGIGYIVLGGWEVADEEDKGSNSHISRHWIWSSRASFGPIRLSRLHLMGRLYWPSPVWYLSLRQ